MSENTTTQTQLGIIVYERLKKRHDEVVVIDADGVKMTGSELLKRAQSAASIMSKSGIQNGDCVIICLVDHVDVLSCVIGSWYLCATPVILDFRTPASQRSAVSVLTGAKIVIENRHPAGVDDYPSLIWLGDKNWVDDGSREFPKPDELDQYPAFISLSSGTTGFPKAYTQSHRQIALRIKTRRSKTTSAMGRFFTPMPMSFSATRQMVFNYLAFEDLVIFGKPLFSTSELIESMLSVRPSACAFPPPIVRKLVKEIGPRDKPFFPELTVLRSIGGPATIEDKQDAYRYLSNGYCMGYSSTLTGPTSLLSGDDVLRKPATSGTAIGGVKIDIVDPLSMLPLEPTQIGLIKVYTPYRAAKVILHPDSASNAERMGDDWGAPGDFGFIDEDGFLTITGREGDMIVRGGVNVAPQELENILIAHPMIDDVAVFGIDDDDFGQEIATVIVSKNGDERTLHELCMKMFAHDRRPRIIKVVERLPYNVNGKLDRKKLQSLL